MCHLSQGQGWLQFPSNQKCDSGATAITGFTVIAFARKHEDEFL
ncbi:hypothetical protein [Campylobacter geochelonis]|nr:hypothetical protein [Campylobacter geochelonis]